MKLSELIAFRNRLEELPVSASKQAADHKLDILMHTVTYPHESSMLQLAQPFIPALESKLKEIHSAFDNFGVTIEQVKQQVREQIAEQEKHWFQVTKFERSPSAQSHVLHFLLQLIGHQWRQQVVIKYSRQI